MSTHHHRVTFARTLVATLALAGIAAVGGAQEHRSDDDFRWEADVVRGARLTVRNLNGDVRVEAGDADEIVVRGTRRWRAGDPGAITIRIARDGPRDRDVLLCGEWERATLDCSERGYAVNNDGRNDARLDLVVTVPRWMRVAASTVNGEVHVAELAGDVSGSVVNGSVAIAAREAAGADVAITTVNGTFRSDHAPPPRRVARGTTRLRLGDGGRRITFTTVNGAMRLVRP